jgi:hypothetical protein
MWVLAVPPTGQAHIIAHMRHCQWLPGLAACAAVALAHAGSAASWSDTALTRLEALALLETLNAELLSSASATLTLEQWCRDHALAEPAQILARRTDTTPEPPESTTRSVLQLTVNESVRYRRVELVCGEHVLSIAENWYVPARLTPAMNQQLETTQVPFGRVVQPLHPHRETILARLLWQPLPPDWFSGHLAADGPSSDPLEMPAGLIEHRAILYSADHRPIAEVHEIYQRDLLDFPEPGLSSSETRLRATR